MRSLRHRVREALARAGGRVFERTLRFPRSVLTVLLVATVAGYLYAREHLEISSSSEALHEQDPELTAHTREYDREFPDPDANRLVVVIEAPTPERAKEFAADLVKRLEPDLRDVLQARYKLDTESLRSEYLLYLSPAELDRLAQGLGRHRDLLEELSREPGLVTLLRGVNREISRGIVSHFFTDFLDESSGGSGDSVDLSLLNRLLGDLTRWAEGGTAVFGSPWPAAFGGGDWKSDDDGYYWADSRRLLLVQVRIAAAHGTSAQRPAVEAVRRAVAASRERFSDVRAGVTGGPALDVDEQVTITNDMVTATVISFVGVALLIAVVFRGIVRPALGLLALTLGVIWAFAFAAAVVGHLNIVSATLGPVLVGLGMDDGIHLLARYENERRVGRSVRAALERATAVVIRPLLTTAASIAAGFYALLVTRVQALEELGLITGTGILLVLLSTLVAFPPLLLLYESWRARRGAEEPVREAGAERPLALFLYGRSRAALIVGGLATALAAASLPRIGYDFNLLHLQAKNTESVDWELRLLQNAGRSAAAYGVVLADSLEEARRKSSALEKLSTVSDAVSIASAIPDDQEAKIPRITAMFPTLRALPESVGAAEPLNTDALGAALRQIRSKLLDPADEDWKTASAGERSEMTEAREHVKSLLALLGREPTRARLAAYQADLLADLAAKLDWLRAALGVAPLTIDELPEELRNRFIGQSGRYLIEVFPRGDFWDPETQARFVADLRSVDPAAVGNPVLLSATTEAMKRGYAIAGVLALVELLVVCGLAFSDWRHAAFASVPLVVGSLWTAGVMSAFGLRFNLGNLLTVPLMVGAGMENGIVLVSRYREDAGRGSFVIPRSTGLGVFLASTTTIVGFGSLMIARHRGLYSIGLLLVVAVSSVFLASFTVLPAWLRLLGSGPSTIDRVAAERRRR